MSSTYKRKESRDLSECILETARALFDEHGVEAVSMHQIAKTAGVGQATLYRRYSQKSELCLDLMEDYINRLQEEVEHTLSSHASATVQERLSIVIQLITLNLLSHSQLMATIYGVIFTGRKCEKEFTAFIQSSPYKFFLGTIQGLLQEAHDHGLTAPSVHPFINAHMLIATLNPQSLSYMLDEASFSPDQLADILVQTLVHSLFKRES